MLYFNTNDKSWDWPVFIANSSKNAGVTTITGSDGIVYSVYPIFVVYCLFYFILRAFLYYGCQIHQLEISSAAEGVPLVGPRIMTDDEFQGRLPGYPSLVSPLAPRLPRSCSLCNSNALGPSLGHHPLFSHFNLLVHLTHKDTKQGPLFQGI